MRSSLILVLLVLAGAFVTGCNNHNCRDACARVYGDGEKQCKATHSNRDFDEPAEAIAQCTLDCQAALYDEAIEEGADNSGLTDEQSAVEFINCVWSVVDPTKPDCDVDARTACGAAVR